MSKRLVAALSVAGLAGGALVVAAPAAQAVPPAHAIGNKCNAFGTATLVTDSMVMCHLTGPGSLLDSPAYRVFSNTFEKVPGWVPGYFDGVFGPDGYDIVVRLDSATG